MSSSRSPCLKVVSKTVKEESNVMASMTFLQVIGRLSDEELKPRLKKIIPALVKVSVSYITQSLAVG